jgi:hypothetical protein
MWKSIGIGCLLALILGCQKSDDGIPPELDQALKSHAAREPTRVHTIGCSAHYGDIKQVVGVNVYVTDPHLNPLDVAAPTNGAVSQAGRDISPKDYKRLQLAIAAAVDERIGQKVVDRVEITEVRYERIVREEGNQSDR